MDTLKLGQIITDPDVKRDAVHVAVLPVVAGKNLYRGQQVGFRSGEPGIAIDDNPIGIVDPFLPDDVKKGQRFWIFLFPGSITSLRHDWTHPDIPDEVVEQGRLRPAKITKPSGTAWRTSTVLAICKGIREDKEWSAMPILADALEDAGYPDEYVLKECRQKARWDCEEIVMNRLISLVESDTADASVRRIEEIAAILDLTYNTLMMAARWWLNEGDYTTEHGPEHWRDTFPEYVDEFWGLYQIVMGITVDGSKQQQFFSCSC